VDRPGAGGPGLPSAIHLAGGRRDSPRWPENTYDPRLYRETGEAFDRAHNAFLDWAVAGGVPALLLYAALLGGALLRLWRSPGPCPADRIGLTALLAGYVVHHLFTFETLYAYLGLFAILACLDAPPHHGVRLLWRPPRAPARAWPRFALPATGAAAVIWLVNAPGIAVAAGCISVSGPMGSARILETFRSILARSPFDGLEIRETLVDLAGEVAAIPAPPRPGAALTVQNR